MNQDTRNALKKAAGFIKSGNTKSARAILINILREEPENAQAWYMLSFSVPVKDKQIYALQQVLTLDPNHQKAISRLKKLSGTAKPLEQGTQKLETTEKETKETSQTSAPAESPFTDEDLLTQRLFGTTSSPPAK